MGSITLTWDDNNATETGHKVYRSQTPMNVASLQAPIATLGADVESYVDANVVEGQTYYYRVAAVRTNSVDAVSAEISVQAVRGPLVAPSGLVLELVVPPTVIGQASHGGYYIGDITVADGGADDGTYAVIMGGLASQATLAWKNPRSTTVGANSNTNGFANSLAMQAADPAIHFAGMYCLNYLSENYDDWYLPAKDELQLAWTNRVNLAELAMEAQWYWSSTDYSSDAAWRQIFNDGGSSSGTKSSTYRVRPTRRIKKS